MKYGDYDNVGKDATIIREIMSRQGNALLLECIADSIGESRIKFNLTFEEARRVMDETLAELKADISERI